MPRILVPYRFGQKLPAYLNALRYVGLDGSAVLPNTTADAAGVLAGCSGLMLTGGTDVDPDLYGEARDSRTDEPDVERDRFESAVLLEALRVDMPVLAICRGMQLMNVVLGGGLLQHIETGITELNRLRCTVFGCSAPGGWRMASTR